MRTQVQSLALLSVAVNCGVGRRCGSDPELLWLLCRPVATAPIGPLAWEPPYAAGMALKRQKDKKKKQFAIIFCETNHLGLEGFTGCFEITNSIYLMDIGLSKLFISYWVTCGSFVKKSVHFFYIVNLCLCYS